MHCFTKCWLKILFHSPLNVQLQTTMGKGGGVSSLFCVNVLLPYRCAYNCVLYNEATKYQTVTVMFDDQINASISRRHVALYTLHKKYKR